MSDADSCNGQSVDLWSYGIPNDTSSDFLEVNFEKSLEELKDYMHGAHAMIYARDDTVLWDRYCVMANIMMQMRFDGLLGFPGGLLDKGNESVVEALHRELAEEINFDVEKFGLSQGDHVCTHVNKKKKLVLHFYAKEVTKDEFLEIERQTLTAPEWGVETLGTIRVPLYVNDDQARGLPIFLANRFAGSAKDQLLISIRRRKILTEEHLEHALSCYAKLVKSNCK